MPALAFLASGRPLRSVYCSAHQHSGKEEELSEDAEKMAPGWSADQLRDVLGDDILAELMAGADWPQLARQLVGLQQAGVDLRTFLPQMGRMTAAVHQAVTANIARTKAEGTDRWANLLKSTMPEGLVRDAAACTGCGAPSQWARGMCKRCYEHSPHTVGTRAAGWARRMPRTPSWWEEFAVHLATHRNVFYSADALAHTARLVIDTDSTDPHGLLAEARRTRPWLTRLLADFFHAHRLLDAPAAVQSTRAATRRERRIEAVPAPLRPAVRAFAEALVARRENAERLGLQPNQLKTIEIRLDTVRDLALHLHAKGHTTWAGVNATNLEAFLARNPVRRASWLAGLRQFFSHAHRTGVVLHDPAAAMEAPQPRGFSGSTLTLDEQRVLYRRWSAGKGVLPLEAFIGLATLLHAATTTELRHLTLVHIGTASRTVRFPRRSVDLALDGQLLVGIGVQQPATVPPADPLRP